MSLNFLSRKLSTEWFFIIISFPFIFDSCQCQANWNQRKHYLTNSKGIKSCITFNSSLALICFRHTTGIYTCLYLFVRNVTWKKNFLSHADVSLYLIVIFACSVNQLTQQNAVENNFDDSPKYLNCSRKLFDVCGL